MTITFYQSTAAPNEVDKSGKLTSVAAYTDAKPNIALDIMNPTIVVEETTQNIMDANYCYITELDRYYHITGKAGPVNGMAIISCTVDPLMSFKDKILALKGIASRNKENYDMYLKDERIPVAARKTISIRKFTGSGGQSGYTPFGVNGAYVYMLVLGG